MSDKGFSIIEVLIAAGIMSVLSLGLVKVLDIALVSVNVGKSLITNTDLKMAIGCVLESGHRG